MTVTFFEGFDQYLGDGVFVPSSLTGHWDAPDTRPRCIADGKVVFRSAGDAKRSAKRATSRGTPMHHYRGQCGHWHTARRKR